MKRTWPGWMKRDTVAAYCDCEPGYIEQLVKRGLLPKPTIIGEMPRWRREAVDAWLAETTDSKAECDDPYLRGVDNATQAFRSPS